MKTGTEFVNALRGASQRAWDEAVLDAVAARNHVDWPMRKIPCGPSSFFYAATDYLAIGVPGDFVRAPVGGRTAETICDRLGFVLPTARMVDRIWATAKKEGVVLAPMTMPWNDPALPMTSVESLSRHNSRIQVALDGAGYRAGETLAAGLKKDVVLSPRMRDFPGQLAFYGWHRLDGSVIQSLNLRAHVESYWDYSHGVRFVGANMVHDGRTLRVADVLEDPRLCALLSDEGPLHHVRYGPMKPITTPPTIKLGSQGSTVMKWQSIVGAPIDGKFGPKTEALTKIWQSRHRLTADGVVGPKTWGMWLRLTEEPTMPEIAETFRFVRARHFRAMPSRKISMLVVHTMEWPERSTTAEDCARFFTDPKTRRPDGTVVPVIASAHYCLAPETRVLFADLVWRPIGDVREGHKLAATEEHAPGMSGRTMQIADVTRVKRREAECVRIMFYDGREVVCSTDHRWLAKPPAGGAPWEWRASEMLTEGCRLLAPLRPWEQRVDRDAGYLEGIYDGEGCWSSNGDLFFAQKRGAVLDRAHGILNAAGIPYRLADQRENGVVVTDLSGLQATLQVVGQFRPQRLMREPRWVGRALRSRTHSNHITIASIERLGIREVVSIETSTHTFFAEGIVSHNCIDNNSIVQCVLDKDIAWHTQGAIKGIHINNISIGLEHAGYARQTPEEWADAYSVAMLHLSAQLAARLCVRYGIEPVRLTIDELKSGRINGFIGHNDARLATGTGTHWDPGPHYPWDWYLGLVKEYMA